MGMGEAEEGRREGEEEKKRRRRKRGRAGWKRRDTISRSCNFPNYVERTLACQHPNLL